jgi:hypothetical protein
MCLFNVAELNESNKDPIDLSVEALLLVDLEILEGYDENRLAVPFNLLTSNLVPLTWIDSWDSLFDSISMTR